MANLKHSDVSTLVLEQYGQLIVDALLTGNQGPGNWKLASQQSVMGRLQANGRIIMGGADNNDRYPREWAIHAATAESSSYGAEDPLPDWDPETFSKAVLEWKREGISLRVDNLERLIGGNSLRGGRNLFALDFEKKMKALVHGLETKLLGDGSGNSGKDLTGFLAFLSDSSTYATVDQSANTYWQAVVNDVSSAALTREIMADTYESVFDNNVDESRHEIWMPYRQFKKWQQVFQGQIEYREDGSTKQGMRAVYSDGAVEIPIHIIKGIPNDQIWWCSMDDLELRFVDHTPEDQLSSVQDMEAFVEGIPVGIEQKATGTDSKAFFLKCYPQLVCMNPKNFAIIDNLAV